jgi:hypothetical protein
MSNIQPYYETSEGKARVWLRNNDLINTDKISRIGQMSIEEAISLRKSLDRVIGTCIELNKDVALKELEKQNKLEQRAREMMES